MSAVAAAPRIAELQIPSVVGRGPLPSSAIFTPPRQVRMVPVSASIAVPMCEYAGVASEGRPKPPLLFVPPYGATQLLPAVRHPDGTPDHPISAVDLLCARGWRVFTFDYRDQTGATMVGPAAAQPWALHDLVREELNAAVEQTRAATGADTVWLAGISLGGVLALLYALEHPHVVCGLTLIGTPVQWTKVPWWIDLLTWWPEFWAWLPTNDLHRLLRTCAGAAPYIPDHLRPEWARSHNADLRHHRALRQVVGCFSSAMTLCVAQWVQARDIRWHGRLLPHAAHRLELPMQIFVGERDCFAPRANVAPLLRPHGTVWPPQRWHYVAGATHWSLIFGRQAVERVYAPMAAELDGLLA